MRMDLLGWLVLAGPTTASAGLLRRWPIPGARDRVQLVIAAYETGLVSPSANE